MKLDPARRAVIVRYFLLMVPGSVAWEFSHMLLYTLWETGTRGDIAFAAVHCSFGDWMIAAGSLALALILVGGRGWPHRRYEPVAVATVAFGLAYTLFSEWLNVESRQSWAYRDAMPRLPFLGTGLTPILQWLVLPSVTFWWARRTAARLSYPRPEDARGSAAERHATVTKQRKQLNLEQPTPPWIAALQTAPRISLRSGIPAIQPGGVAGLDAPRRDVNVH